MIRYCILIFSDIETLAIQLYTYKIILKTASPFEKQLFVLTFKYSICESKRNYAKEFRWWWHCYCSRSWPLAMYIYIVSREASDASALGGVNTCHWLLCLCCKTSMTCPRALICNRPRGTVDVGPPKYPLEVFSRRAELIWQINIGNHSRCFFNWIIIFNSAGFEVFVYIVLYKVY